MALPQATYWSLENADDIAWSYPEPPREAAEVSDRIAFFNERVDLIVDGTRLERPVAPWSPRWTPHGHARATPANSSPGSRWTRA